MTFRTVFSVFGLLKTARVVLALLLALSLASRAFAQIAVIANKSKPVPGLSLDELRRLYLGQTSRLAGTRVTLVETAPVRAPFYRAVAQLSEAQVDRAWLAVVFQGGDATPPRKFTSAVEARRYVVEHPEAIAFIPLDALDDTVAAIPINGKNPRESGYPIQ